MIYLVCDGDEMLCAYASIDEAYRAAFHVASDLERSPSEFTITRVPFVG